MTNMEWDKRKRNIFIGQNMMMMMMMMLLLLCVCVCIHYWIWVECYDLCSHPFPILLLFMNKLYYYVNNDFSFMFCHCIINPHTHTHLQTRISLSLSKCRKAWVLPWQSFFTPSSFRKMSPSGWIRWRAAKHLHPIKGVGVHPVYGLVAFSVHYIRDWTRSGAVRPKRSQSISEIFPFSIHPSRVSSNNQI